MIKSEIEIYNEFAIQSLIIYWNTKHDFIEHYLHAAIMFCGKEVSDELFFLQHINAIKRAV